MPINVNNPEADSLPRRSTDETPRETAARLRAKHRLSTGKQARRRLSTDSWDAMWGS